MARMPEGSLVFEQSYWPFLEGDEDLSRIEATFLRHMWTGLRDAAGAVHLRPGGAGRRSPRFCAPAPTAPSSELFGGNLLEMGQFLYRIDNFLMMLAGEPRARPSLS